LSRYRDALQIINHQNRFAIINGREAIDGRGDVLKVKRRTNERQAVDQVAKHPQPDVDPPGVFVIDAPMPNHVEGDTRKP
jgi:hypothetical protein